MKYDVGYNLTEDVRQLMDADYKKDIESFETAKKHILLLLGKPDIDTQEYTDKKKILVQDFFKALDEHMKLEHDEQLISLISKNIQQFIDFYNVITLKYMDDTLNFLMGIINGGK